MINPANDNDLTPEMRLKRLRYRSWHRGWKETDIILGNFSEERLTSLPADLLDSYDKLLDEPDVDIWNWLMSDTSPPPDYVAILDIIRDYTPPTA